MKKRTKGVRLKEMSINNERKERINIIIIMV